MLVSGHDTQHMGGVNNISTGFPGSQKRLNTNIL